MRIVLTWRLRLMVVVVCAALFPSLAVGVVARDVPAALLSAAAAAVVGALSIFWLTAPVRRLASGIRRVQDGELSARISPHAGLGLDGLTNGANEVFDALEHVVAQVKERTTQDSLTGLANYSHFYSRLHQETQRALRYRHALSVVFIDLDHFQEVSKQLSDDQSDSVLVQIARCMETCTRAPDLVARYQGELFAAILPETDQHGAAVMAERCRVAVHQSSVLSAAGAYGRALTASLGIATLGGNIDDTDVLITAAQTALGQARRSGGNRVAIAPAIESALAETAAS